METNESLNESYFLELARQCRRLAQQSLSYYIAEELEKLASDYERDAARLGSFGASRPGSPRLQTADALRSGTPTTKQPPPSEETSHGDHHASQSNEPPTTKSSEVAL